MGVVRLAETEIHSILKENVEFIREQISLACHQAGRHPGSVRFVAVTKYAKDKWIRFLPNLGITDFGESRVQQLVTRSQAMPDITWHMIGHLQRNKVRSAIPAASLIHSLDSLRLAERVQQVAEEYNRPQPVLIEVNVSGEESKSGISMDELRESWDRFCIMEHVTIQGLMTMAPKNANELELRQVFGNLRKLRDELSDHQNPLPELSMGMSNDFPIAIEEGATLVRIGSRLFEGLEEATLNSRSDQ